MALDVFGEMLREERNRRGKSVEDAAAYLKLHPSLIRDMEAGSEENNLPPVYLRGFLKDYGVWLGIDKAKIDEVLEDFGLEEKKPEVPIPIEEKHRSPVGIVVLAVVVVLFLAGYLIYNPAKKFISSVEIDSPSVIFSDLREKIMSIGKVVGLYSTNDTKSENNDVDNTDISPIDSEPEDNKPDPSYAPGTDNTVINEESENNPPATSSIDNTENRSELTKVNSVNTLEELAESSSTNILAESVESVTESPAPIASLQVDDTKELEEDEEDSIEQGSGWAIQVRDDVELDGGVYSETTNFSQNR